MESKLYMIKISFIEISIPVGFNTLRTKGRLGCTCQSGMSNSILLGCHSTSKSYWKGTIFQVMSITQLQSLFWRKTISQIRLTYGVWGAASTTCSLRKIHSRARQLKRPRKTFWIKDFARTLVCLNFVMKRWKVSWCKAFFTTHCSQMSSKGHLSTRYYRWWNRMNNSKTEYF